MTQGNERNRCLNCGTEVDSMSNFCSQCGQSMATSRLTLKSTIYESLIAILRVDRGFLYTSWLLITRPWIVIRDYVRGRRVKYAPAVKMLIILSLFMLLADSLFALDDADDNVGFANIASNHQWIVAFMRFYEESIVTQLLVLTIPASLAIYAVYWRYNSRRYNFAEYITASVYLCDAMLIIQLLLYPIEVLNSGLSDMLLVIWTFVIGVMSVTRAFSIKNYAVAAATMLLWALFTFMLEALIHYIPLLALSVLYGIRMPF